MEMLLNVLVTTPLFGSELERGLPTLLHESEEGPLGGLLSRSSLRERGVHAHMRVFCEVA